MLTYVRKSGRGEKKTKFNARGFQLRGGGEGGGTNNTCYLML